MPRQPYGYRGEQRFPRRRPGDWFACLPILVAIVVVLGIAGTVVFNIVRASHRETHVCTVSDKSQGFDKDGKGIYRVYTSCGVYEVQDAWYAGNYNSADLYGSLQRGHTYDITSLGFRNGFFSSFPNIVKATAA